MVKEVQQLAKRITALSRFLFWSTETTVPIFNTLKNEDTFTWTTESEEAFLRLKVLLASPSFLMKPMPDIPLLIYISVVDDAVSATIVQEKEGKQYPVYFTRKVLQDVERRYQKIEKAALTFIIAFRKLRPYFQGYLSRGHVKAQALADFIIEMAVSGLVIEESGGWLLSVNEASNQSRSGARVILEGPNWVLIEQSLHFEFKATNNQAEYETLLAGMRLAKELEAKTLTTKSDSKCITSQVNREYQTRDPQLIKYLERATGMAATFEKFTLYHVPGNKTRELTCYRSSPPHTGEECNGWSYMRA
ncbi:Protein NYNRIN, partial [Mucuna pruriens]